MYRALDPSFVDAAVHAYNGVIAGAAARHGAVVVDLYGGSHRLWGHPELLSYDGFHPSTRGYRVLADAFAEAIKAHGPASGPAPGNVRGTGTSGPAPAS